MSPPPVPNKVKDLNSRDLTKEFQYSKSFNICMHLKFQETYNLESLQMMKKLNG